jgi:hypothetical protein
LKKKYDMNYTDKMLRDERIKRGKVIVVGGGWIGKAMTKYFMGWVQSSHTSRDLDKTKKPLQNSSQKQAVPASSV